MCSIHIWLRIGSNRLYCWVLMCAVHIVWPLGKNAKELAWNDKNANTGNYVHTVEKYKSDDVYMSMPAPIESFHVLSGSGGTPASNQDGITSNMYHSIVHMFNAVDQPLTDANFMSKIEYWWKEVCTVIAELNMQLNARLKIFTTSTFITLEESQSLLCVLLLFSAVRVFANPCKVVCRAVQEGRVCARARIECWQPVQPSDGRWEGWDAQPTRASSVSHCMRIGCMDGHVSSRIRCACAHPSLGCICVVVQIVVGGYRGMEGGGWGSTHTHRTRTTRCYGQYGGQCG